MLPPSRISFTALVAIALVVPINVSGQGIQAMKQNLGSITGTVTDVNGDPVPNATVLLKRTDSNDSRTVVTLENGFFESQDVKPDVPYEISVSAKGFADWTSHSITLESGQFKILMGIQLRIPAEITDVEVTFFLCPPATLPK